MTGLDPPTTETGLWIALGMLANAVIAILFGYFRHPPFVSSHRLEDLQSIVIDLRAVNATMREEIATLRQENRVLERSRAFWQKSYEDLKEGTEEDRK
jgi:hypothetical protein